MKNNIDGAHTPPQCHSGYSNHHNPSVPATASDHEISKSLQVLVSRLDVLIQQASEVIPKINSTFTYFSKVADRQSSHNPRGHLNTDDNSKDYDTKEEEREDACSENSYDFEEPLNL